MNKLNQVAKDMVGIEFPDELLEQLDEIFFDFCRKHNIKHGTPIKRKGKIIGYRQASYDWTMTNDFFFNRLKDAMIMRTLFDNIPEDLKG